MYSSKESLDLHESLRGKLEVISKINLKNKKNLALAYTPGVAEPVKEIVKNKKNIYKYTIKGNSVAVVTDGSAVLGLGNVGPEAALPVMEGKAAIFKEFANIDAFPICLATQNTKEIVQMVKILSPTFGAINLEDIAAPRCFEIEEALQDIGIPVFHDDQHGTAIAVLAALQNALKVANKKMSHVKIVISGAGAAGTAIAKLLKSSRNIIVCDSTGILSKKRADLNKYKRALCGITNPKNIHGSLGDALVGADVFIGVSRPNTLTAKMIKTMNVKPIIFAMANPIPEIMPDKAIKAGAFIVATGRSDFPNQVNNALVFPGIFRGALDARIPRITQEMKISAAKILAGLVATPSRQHILPPL
ncbi:MAG: NADP-dependent malic enzyme, partial [Candidatus Colwellbacteria bacterium]|nr:NADP-dependent malic enzyme [Candidatus Colwellbacteria bacterium]